MNKEPSYVSRLQEAKSLVNRGLYQEALELFEALRKEHPDKAKPIFGIGVCLFAMEERTQALKCFIQVSNLEPENAENYAYMGHCFNVPGQERMAIKHYEKALEIDNNNFQVLTQLGRLYLERERNIEAVDILKKAVAIKATDVGNQINLGFALAKTGNYEEAVKHANEAIRLEPNNLFVNFVTGEIHFFHGNQTEAEKFFNKTLEINPQFASAYYALVSKKITANDQALIDKMESALNQGMSSEDQRLLLYALAKAYNDIAQSDKAFAYARKASEFANADYDPISHTHHIREIKKFFSEKFFKRIQRHSSTPYTPVFIVGMPRSGSTLVDQILSTHSAVHSGGESAALGDSISEIRDNTNNKTEYPACLNEFNQQDIEKYSNAYIQKIAKGVTNATHIVDKNLFNYENLGLIAMLFPDAKIIHTKRHPLDTALSCYLTGFTAGLSWTSDLECIGKYYLDYIDLMDYWHKTLPIPILDVQYENMVEDPETNIRRILEFCGLHWEDACMEFYKSKRSVNTASILQVRQPVYKSSVQRWVPYAKHLQPLILALGDLLESDYDKIESLDLKHGPRHNRPRNFVSKLFK